MWTKFVFFAQYRELNIGYMLWDFFPQISHISVHYIQDGVTFSFVELWMMGKAPVWDKMRRRR